MKVDCTLTPDEKDALCILMGMGTGVALNTLQNVDLAKAGIRVLNKLLDHDPEYSPYDENSFDPNKPGIPFNLKTPQ